MLRAAGGQRGITLLELLVVLATLSVLVSIGVPSAQRLFTDARRADARQVLLINAQRLEQCFALAGAYNTSCPLRNASKEGHYTASATTTATTYTVQAVPVAGGAQATDAQCRQLALDHRGLKTATGESPERCW